MPIIIHPLPNVTISQPGAGGASDFGLDGTVSPGATTASFSQAAFTVYISIYGSGEPAPVDGAAVESGAGAVATANGNAIASILISGLSAETTYDLYSTGKDAAGEYTAVNKVSFTTDADGGAVIPGQYYLDFSEENYSYATTEF